MKKYVLLLLSSIFIFLAACNSESKSNDESSFSIGVIPAQTEGAMADAMEKLQDTLSKDLDREVTVDVYPDYNGVVEALNYDKIEMAYLGPLTYVIAYEQSGAEAIITQLIDGEPFYYSYLITHKDNPWNSLDEIVEDSGNIDFAFGDPSSTSGSLIPSIELEEQGVYQSEDEHEFSSVRFTGSHDATALAIQNKQVDVGAIDSAIYDQLVEAGKVDGEQLKIIWKSEKLFQYPWAVNQNVEENVKKQLQESFLSIEDQTILDAFGATGFTTATNEDYESIRKAAIKQGIISE